MSVKRQTQTVTITLSMDQDLDSYDSPLEALREELDALDYVDETDFTIEVVEAGEVTVTGGRTDTQRARLLELKGWAFAEWQKQERGLPSEWNQGDWLKQTSCGTACCIAGKVVLDDGGLPAGAYGPPVIIAGLVAEGETFSYAVMPNRDRVFVEDYAREQLGLDENEADRLFSATNTYSSIAEIIDQLVADV